MKDSGYFKEYSKPGDSPSKEEIKDFLEKSKKADEFIKEWDLSSYDQYLADLYMFVGGWFGWSQSEFDNTDINLVLYYRDRILEAIENNLDDNNKKALPVSSQHWALILTMRKVFGGKKNK